MKTQLKADKIFKFPENHLCLQMHFKLIPSVVTLLVMSNTFISVFIFLQQEPLTLRGAGVLIYLLICSRAGGRKTERRRRVDGQMESLRGGSSGGSYFYLPISHPVDVGG